MPTQRYGSFALLLTVALASCKLSGTAPGQFGQVCPCASGLTCVKNSCQQSCTADSDCPASSGTACGTVSGGSGNFCAKTCTAQTDCFVGQACGLAYTGAASATCYPETFAMPADGGFGTDCEDYACGTGANPCASGFSCASGPPCGEVNPSICSATCSTDLDCPPTYFCANTASPVQNAENICLPRGRCDSCVTDDQCAQASLGGSVPGAYVCAADDLGGHFCAQTCNTDSDCLHPYTTDTASTTLECAPFEVCKADQTGSKVCTPVAGACHGKSNIASVTADPGICSPCRPGVRSDCDPDAGLLCYPGPYGENDCTEDCTITAQIACNSKGKDCQVTGFTGDTCPSGTYCVFGGEFPESCGAPSCTVQGLCFADPEYSAFTCYIPDGGMCGAG